MATAMSVACTNARTEVAILHSSELRHGDASTSGRETAHPGFAKAVAALTAGDVVAIPTETVYGLAANALSASAVGRVYAAKNRPADNPLIVHISSLEMLSSLYPPGWTLPPVYEAVIRDLWPGPLTILLPRSMLVPDVVTCGLPTMAVRMPAHPAALSLIAACGFPLAAPSANSSGRPSPTLARHVLADLGGRIPLILDGGACTCGVESTVLDALRNPPAILRPGGVTHEQLACYPGLAGLQVYRRDFVDPQLEAAPSTPGMKYRHYSPTAQVLLLDPGDPPASVSDQELAARLHRGAEALLGELLGGGEVAGAGAAAGDVHSAQLTEEQQQQRHGRRADLVGVLRTSLPGLPSGPLLRQPAVAPPPTPEDGSQPLQPPCPSHDHSTAHQAARSALDPEARPNTPEPSPEPPGPRAAPPGGQLEQPQAHQPQPLPAPPPLEYVLGYVSRPAQVASELFAALRHLDELGVATIVVEGVRDSGAGVAVMNRLRKAASRVVYV